MLKGMSISWHLNGSKGTYLLDPSTIEIYGNVTPAFNATDSSISLSLHPATLA